MPSTLWRRLILFAAVALFPIVALAQTVDLQTSLSDTPDPLTLGQGTVSYSASVYNNSSTAATNVTLTFNAPASSTLGTYSANFSGSCNAVSQTVTCTWSSVPAFNSRTLSADATPTAGGTLTATASATSNETDSNGANNNASTSTTVNAQIDLKVLSITDTPDPITLGTGNITYTVTIYNESTSKATNPFANITLPAASTFVSATPSNAGTCGTGASFTCNWTGDFNAFNSRTVTVVVTPTAGGTATLTATTGATQGDPDSSDNTLSQSTTVNAQIDVKVSSISDTPDPITLGQGNITYTVNLYNESTSKATNLFTDVTIPAASTFVSATASSGGTCGSGASFTCNWTGDFNAFNSRTITVTVTPNGGGTATLNATTGADQGDPDASDNSGSASTTVNAQIDLKVSSLSDTPDPITLGTGNITYTVNLYNESTSKATNPFVNVTIPAGATFVSAAANSSGTCGSGASFTCNWAGDFNAFNSRTITVTVTPNSGGTATLSATVGADQGDPDATDNTGSESTTVNAQIDVKVSSLSDTPDPITLGQGNITYTVNLYNESTSKATNLFANVTIPAASTFVSATATSGGTCGSGASFTCNWAGDFPAFNSRTITVVVTPTAGGTATLSATTGADQTDPDTADNSGSVSTTVNAQIDVKVSGVYDSIDPMTLGTGNVTYTVSLYNESTSKATNLFTNITIPASSTFVSASANSGGTCGTGASFTCNWAGDFNAFNSRTVTVTVTPTAGGTLTLSATAGADQPDPDAADNTLSENTTVNAQIDLQVSGVSDSPDQITLGTGNVTYTVSIYNQSTSKATNPFVNITLPTASTFVSATPNASGTCGGPSGNIVTCNWSGDFNAFNARSITVVVTPTAGGTMTLSATVGADQPDPDATDDTLSQSTTVNAQIDVQLTLGDSPDPRTLAAGNVTYTVNLYNASTSKATNPVVTFTFPASTTFVSATPNLGGTCTAPSGNVFTCTWAGDFNAFNSRSLSVVVTPAAVGLITASAGVTADQGDPNTSNNNDAETTSINPGSAPTIGSFAPGSGPVGTTVSISGSNFFSSTSVKFNGVNASSYSVDTNGSITAVVPAGATTGPIAITNAVGTTTSGSNFTVTPAPDLTVSKTASVASTAASTSFDYFLAVANNGAGTANDATVTDTLPAGVTLNSTTAPGWSCSGTTTVTCTHGPLASLATANVITLNVTAPGSATTVTNTATVTSTTPDANNANNSGSVSVSITGCPSTPPITAPATVCANSTGHSANTPVVPGATSYVWSILNGTITGGQGTDAITFGASSADPITLSVDVLSACATASNSVNVTVSTPTATIAPSGPTSFCTGGSVTLTANAGSSWLWSTGATTQSIAVNTSGAYTVDVTNANGCTATSAPVNVTVFAPPATPTIAPSGPTTFCAGGSVTLTASAGASWLWSNGATTQSIVAASSDSYSVTVTDANGCSATSAPTVVTVSPAPSTPTITPGGPTTFCTGGSVTLTASAGNAWLWSNGANTQSINVTASGTFTVQVTDANGCTATSAPATVTVNTVPPTPTITASGPTTFCAGGNVTLTSSPGDAWLWSTGATTQSIVVNAAGSYTVQVTNANGCTATSAPASVTVTSASVTITGPPTSCVSAPVTLDAGPGFAQYAWSTGATTQQITVSPGSTAAYSVTVTDGGGCTATDSHTVTVTPNPATTISAPAAVCENAPGNNASVPVQGGATYAWTIANGVFTSATNGNAVTFTAGPSGSVTLDVTVTNGSCVSTGNATIPISAYPTVAISGPTEACPSAPFTLSVPATFATYAWSTGHTGPTATISQTNPSETYTVVVTNAAGCSASATHTVSLTSSPVAAITAPPSADYGAAHAASVPAQPGATYLWSITNGTIDAGQGTSTVTFTTANSGATTTISVDVAVANCSQNASATVTLVDPPSPCGTAPASLISPANNAAAASTVFFDWSAVAGATSYDFRLDGAVVANVGTTSITRTLAPGPHTWSVTAHLGDGCDPLTSATRSLTVEGNDDPDPCAARTAATPVSPANGAVVNGSSVDFTWLPANGAGAYRIWASVDGAPFAVLGETPATSLRATLARGSVAWFAEALFAGCASTESQVFHFTIPPAPSCGNARAELVSPVNDSVVTDGNVTFTWNGTDDALQYELWLSLADGTPALIGTTTQTSLTRPVPAGKLEWFVRTLVDRCPPRDSRTSRFTYTPPASCETNQRPILIEPLNGVHATAPLTFSWSGNAQRYELFLTHGDNLPIRVADITATQVPINMPAGKVRWFVRGHFGPGCTPLDSAEQQVEIVATPQACSPLAPPLLAAPGQISAGTQLRIQWSPVPGASSYQLELAGNAAFENAQSITTNATQHPFTPQGDTVHARVRALDLRCATANESAFSTPARIFVLPAASTTGSTPLNDPAPLTFTYILGPDYAGQSFTAVSKQPWLTVTPASGVVAAAGTTLTVVADTEHLPVGTSVGAIAITLNAPAAGNVATNDSTTITPSFSVGLVTPVTPATKTTPPPDALIIPAVAHADGINSHFQSDVRIANTSPRLVTYQLTFTPSGDSGIAQGRQSTFSVEPGRTVALDDVLKDWFGTGNGSATGTLEIRPLADDTAAGNAFTGLASLTSFASSRTFNVTSNGTFGQYIPAIPFANFIGSQRILSLQQIAQSARYRTNLGIVEGSGEPADLIVRMFGSDGAQLGSFPVSLNGGQHVQLNSFLRDRGVDNLDDGRVEIEVVSAGGKVTAYASVLDNLTSDPLLVTPVPIDAEGATKWVVPGVADLAGGFANWQTDMRLFNAGAEDVEATLTFFSQNGGEPKTANVTIGAGKLRQFNRALQAIFGVTDDGGAVHITTPAAARLIATARTYNLTSGGTYGQFISAVTPNEAAGAGARPLQLLQVEESNRFRSNVGIVEVTGQPVRLEIAVVPPDSKFTAVTELFLAGNEFRQFGSLLASMGLADTHNARVTVRVLEGAGRVTAYASVIDMLTNDPTYVPAQ